MALRRKNLMVDDARLKALATRFHTSASAAVRRAIDLALAAEEADAALKRLQSRGTLEDAYKRVSKR